MESALERLKNTIEHLNILNEVLLENDEYEEYFLQLDSTITSSILEKIYPRFDKTSSDRNMALADLLQYILLSRGYYDITKRRNNNTKDKAFKRFYKVIIRLINVLYMQDSILSSENGYEYRRNLIEDLKTNFNINKHEKYDQVSAYKGFLHQATGNNRSSNDERASIYKLLDELLPKVRGIANELITIICLIRKKMGYIIPLLNYQKILGANYDTDNMIDFMTPPDLLLLKKNKEIFGIEIGRGTDRQSNKFSSLTGIPVITVDTYSLPPFRCPKCGHWILFCKKAVEKGLDEDLNANGNKMLCKNCEYFEKGYCKNSAVKTSIKEFYSGKAHYHYDCVKEFIGDEEKNEIFTYIPFINM